MNKAIRNHKHIHGNCNQAVISALDMYQVTLRYILIILTGEVLFMVTWYLHTGLRPGQRTICFFPTQLILQ